MGVAAVSGVLVRTAELRQVRDFAQQVRAAPAALAIQGEAGAGKSTLWRAGIEAAEAAGHRVLRSEPSASETDLAFAALSDLLAEVLPLVEARIPGPQREALEVALLLRPAGEEPPAARAIGLAMLTALRGCLSQHPVLVAIDDVQWLDEASREVLTFALRRVTDGPLSLLLAARTEAAADPLTVGAPPPPRDWHELLTALPATAEVIDLAPLDLWQVQNLLPPDVTATRARLVARQSRGNPFWALQLSASLDADDSQVPPLARTLTDRLASSLSAEAAAALAAVAAAGRTGLPEALAVLDHLADPAAAVDEAVLAGVVVETRDRLSAAHPLIGAAAVQSLPPGRRAQLYRRLAGAGQLAWLSRLEIRRGNLSAALSWLTERNQPGRAVDLIWATWRFWWLHGHAGELARHVDAILAHAGGMPPHQRALALSGAGFTRLAGGDQTTARRLFKQSLPLYRQAGDRLGLGLAAAALGHLLAAADTVAVARDLLEQTLSQLRDMAGGQFTEPQRVHYLLDVALASNFLGQIQLDQGDHRRAAELFTDGLAAAHSAADRFTILVSLYDLALSRQAGGDLDDAASLLRQGLSLAAEAGDEPSLAYYLEALADLAARQDHPERAAALLAAAGTVLEAKGSGWLHAYVPRAPHGDSAVARLRARATGAAFGQAWAYGRSLTGASAVRYALQEAPSRPDLPASASR